MAYPNNIRCTETCMLLHSSISGSLFAIGECGSFEPWPSKQSEQYDDQLDTWTDIPDMQIRRQGHTLAAMKDHIYCIGGRDGDRALDVVERYSPEKQSWFPFPPMHTARYDAASAVLETKIYVMGGQQTWDRKLDDVECYDQKDHTWTRIQNMIIGRSWFSAAVVAGKIFVIGGEGGWWKAESIESYHPDRRRWKVVEEFPRYDHHVIYGPAAVVVKLQNYTL